MSRGVHLSDLPPEVREAVRARARIGVMPPRMNKTETRRAKFLESLKVAGEIHDWRFEAINLRLGDNTHLRMDFLVIHNDGGVELEDVKGRKGDGPYMTEDARAKIYAAASMYPWFHFSIVWEAARGDWQKREVRPT